MNIKVIIPIYKTSLDANEVTSFEKAYSTLSDFPITVIKPETLDLSSLKNKYPLIHFESFDDSFFKGIPGYNKLMLSSTFYERFIDSDYILIYQLDAYVFRNELLYWCSKDYDYIGAPWLKRPIYDVFPINLWMKFTNAICKPNRQELFNKVGNGGLSLRKVASHISATQLYSEEINHFLSQKQSHLYNEDVFWATIPSNPNKISFKYPEYLESLKFSFDKNPAYCYKINNYELPFGCHAWTKKRMNKFWKNIIKQN